MFYYHTLKELEDLVNENKLEVWQVIEQSDMEENGRTKEQSYEKMLNMYLAMKEADKNYNGNLKSASKRAGGDGEKIHRYNAANKNICGKFIGNVMEKAIKMGESNACMRRIVAAPTAGACGVLPAVLISYQEEYNLSDDEMVKAMYVAAGIGKVIAENAFIAGAAGGCQGPDCWENTGYDCAPDENCPGGGSDPCTGSGADCAAGPPCGTDETGRHLCGLCLLQEFCGIVAHCRAEKQRGQSRDMSKRILARLGLLIVVLFGVTVLTFFYTNLSPVDAAEALAVRRYIHPTAQQVELVRGELGLDQPILQQYGSWLWNALHGDFGNSYNTGRPIVEELTAAIRPTLVMAAMALLFATLISIPLGVLSASRKGGLSDRSIYLFGIICMSLPNYWIGFMLLLAFAVYLPIFSIMGADSLKDFVLPALALAIPMAAGNIRVFRSSLLDGYNSDFVLYARARGVSEWKIANLVSRFALPPLITMLAQSFGFMIAGSAMVESVFSIPGLGSMLVTALGARDTITINACVLLTAVIFVLVNFIADCVNALLNPQSQKGGGL